MLPIIIAIIAILALILQWIFATQKKLMALDENCINAMNQIGTQLSSQFDILICILDLIKGYEPHESENLLAVIQTNRKTITTLSASDDVLQQEKIISDVMRKIVNIAKHHPELNENQTYIKALDALHIYEIMVRTSRLIYNDSVTKLNREIRMLPASMLAGTFGIPLREYLMD